MSASSALFRSVMSLMLITVFFLPFLSVKMTVETSAGKTVPSFRRIVSSPLHRLLLSRSSRAAASPGSVGSTTEVLPPRINSSPVIRSIRQASAFAASMPPSGDVIIIPSMLLSKKARYRPSLSRSASSAFLPSVMSSMNVMNMTLFPSFIGSERLVIIRFSPDLVRISNSRFLFEPAFFCSSARVLPSSSGIDNLYFFRSISYKFISPVTGYF